MKMWRQFCRSVQTPPDQKHLYMYKVTFAPINDFPAAVQACSPHHPAQTQQSPTLEKNRWNNSQIVAWGSIQTVQRNYFNLILLCLNDADAIQELKL